MQDYSYDANGNLLCINTSESGSDASKHLSNSRRMLWDEENRLLAVNDNGFVSNYWYDASGERAVKLLGEGQGMFVNGQQAGGRTSTTSYTAYVSPYVVVTNGGQMSKHIYIGSQRIVSQLCNAGSLGDASRNPLTTTPAALTSARIDSIYALRTSRIKVRYDSLGAAYRGTDKRSSATWALTPTVNESDQYYYHPDHLGSSSLITNLSGETVQHLEYVPFGEVLVDERANSSVWNTPYKFNAKELDEETGICYLLNLY